MTDMNGHINSRTVKRDGLFLIQGRCMGLSPEGLHTAIGEEFLRGEASDRPETFFSPVHFRDPVSRFVKAKVESLDGNRIPVMPVLDEIRHALRCMAKRGDLETADIALPGMPFLPGYRRPSGKTAP